MREFFAEKLRPALRPAIVFEIGAVNEDFERVKKSSKNAVFAVEDGKHNLRGLFGSTGDVMLSLKPADFHGGEAGLKEFVSSLLSEQKKPAGLEAPGSQKE